MIRDILSLKDAIVATVIYFDLFDFPLTIQEISEYLYGWSAPQDVIAETMPQIHEVFYADGFYFLKGRDELVALRRERHLYAARLWKKVKRFGWLFALCPFVRMVGIVNSLAYGNVKPESDIDMFVVAKKNRQGSCRFFMKVLMQIFGMRVHHEKIAGRFCLSFFVTEDAMNLETLAHEFDPHLAYFVLALKPVFGEETYYKFLKENDAWTAKYLRKPLKPCLNMLKKHPIASFFRFIFEILFWISGDFLERILYKYQNKRDMERKKQFPKSEGIVLNKKVFKFHEKDPRREIAQKLSY